MVYGLLAVVLFCLSLKGYCGKKTSNYVTSTGDSYTFNLLRMVFCILIGTVLVLGEGAGEFLVIELPMLGICLLSGAANAAFLVGWILAIRKNSMVSVDVGLTMGSIVPAVLCAFLFGEAISWMKMIGFALILLATAILAARGSKKVNGSFSGLLLLIFAALGDGMTGFAQQLFKQFYTESGICHHGVFYPKSVYHFYTYVFAALVLLLALIGYHACNHKKGETVTSQKRLALPLPVVLHVLVMAICLFVSNYLQTVITNDFAMPSQVLYPVIKGGCLITVNLTAMLFFGERITWRSALGSLIALGGIVCMNVL